MNYNKEKGICIYCNKKRYIFKNGYCQSCYKLILKTTYILNPNVKFYSNSEKEMIMYFLENPNISKKDLAKKFNVAISTVYYNIQKHVIKVKTEN